MNNLGAFFYKTSEHLGIMYDNARSILDATDNPLRFAFSALALRELFREYFAIAAPDEAIQSCCWWTASDGKVTRRDRLKFLIFSYVEPNVFPDSYVGKVDDVCADFVERIDALCQTLHITRDELTKAESEQREGIDCTIETFRRALNLIAEFHEELRDKLETMLTEALDEEFVLGPAFDDLDTLSTHTRPTGVWDTEVEISDIDNEFVYFKGSGSIFCDLQYGSDGDVSRGDGAAFESSFPFTFEGRAPVDDPRAVRVSRESIEMDTSDYYK